MASQTVRVYRTSRLYWECIGCKQPHDWVDEGQLDDGTAVTSCRSCHMHTVLVLSKGDSHA